MRVGRLHVVSVTAGGVFLVSGDVDDLASSDGEVLVPLGVTGTDLGALGVEGNGDGAARLRSLGGAGIVDDGLVVLVGAVGEVHANNVEASSTQPVDGLGGVGLGANGADDGGAAEVPLGGVGGVEGGEPVNLAAQLEVVLGSGSHDAVGAEAVRGHGD